MDPESDSNVNNSCAPNKHIALLHSLGYECHRHYNLCVVDENTLAFCSGRLLHLFDTETRQLTTRVNGKGAWLGFVTTFGEFEGCVDKCSTLSVQKNPAGAQIAVGEKGVQPKIVIYSYPDFEVLQTLNNGTAKGYVFLAYSPDGKVLCAQGDSPDYSLTLWDWQAGVIIARASSPFTLRVQFSTFNHNFVVSCGDQGLSFWHLTKTFTGMKLMQQQGHFNTLDRCQVLAAFVMPDGQVVSGCAWGNILLWSSAEGRVIAEACQRSREPCHSAPIVHFAYNQLIDELYTFGMDGWIKMWHYGRFKSDTVSYNNSVVIKPVFEIQVQDDMGLSVLSYMLKKNDDPNDSTWFAQDQRGALWAVDVKVSATVQPPVRLHRSHAAAIVAVASSARNLLFASLAANGVIHIYSFVTGKLLAVKEFSTSGTALCWLPIQLMSGEEVVAAGFADGSLKTLSLSLDNASIRIVQETKPHKTTLSSVSLSPANEFLVTGSQDGTVFIYKLLETGMLSPMGYMQFDSPVQCFSWRNDQINLLLVCCANSLNEAVIPDQTCATISYKINTSVTTISCIKTGDKLVKNFLYAKYSKDSTTVYSADSYGLYEFNWEAKSILQELAVEQEISTINIVNDGNIWFVGLKSGSIRIFTKSGEEWLTKDNFEDISLHDSEGEGIADICLSWNLSYLVDCGFDGNLFVHSLQLDGSLTTDVLPQIFTCKEVSPEEIEDLLEESGVSLEEAKNDSVLKEKMAVFMFKKIRTQKQLASLRSRYYDILKRNSKLPESQILRHSEFKLDKRIQIHTRSIIDEEMKLVKQKLNFDVEKTQLRLQKLKSYFIDCLAAFHIEISSLRGNKTVATFVHRKLGKEFEQGEAMIKNLLKKTNEKIRNSSIELYHKPVVELSPTLAIEVDTDEPYVRSIQDIHNKLNIKTRRALEKHTLMKKKKEERKREWQIFMATRPDQEKSLSADISATEHAARTIGDYKLKQSDNFKLPDQSSNTSLHKLNQLVEAKREIFNLKEKFNHKIYKLRDKKEELVKQMRKLEKNLVDLQTELPKDSIIQPAISPVLNVPREFPERQYQINPGKDPGISSGMPPVFDEEFFILYDNGHLFQPDQEEKDDENSLEDTLWETQIRKARTIRQIFKQSQMLKEMEILYLEFDQSVEELCQERLQLSFDIKYLESFVSVLHQELHIMHSYDSPEVAILERVNNSLAEKHTKHLKINILQHKIDARIAEVGLLEEKLACLEKCFSELASGSRIAKHLERIFRKKYRLQILHSEDEEGSDEESSSEDSSEDSDSAVNVSVGKRSPRSKTDKCPPDCDQNLHQQAVSLRSKRHIIEAKITAEKQTIEQMSREKERVFKFLKLIEPVLRMNQDQLEKLQKEKQIKLNEIEVLVVLNCSQICGQNLLMSKDDLEKLRGRVSELQHQTDSQLEKLKKSQRYQQRVTDECFQMEYKINQLKKDIDKAMLSKFGQQVDVEELEENILEEMIKKTRQSLREEELHKQYERMIRRFKEELLEKTEDLADVMRENTHKLQMLSSLEEEKQKLITLAKRVKKSAAEANDREAEYSQDVQKLTRILQNLILQKETLIHEIKVLSLKGRPLPPIPSIIEDSTTKSSQSQSQTNQSQSRDSDDLASNESPTNREQDEPGEKIETEQQVVPDNKHEEIEEEFVEQESESSDYNGESLDTFE